MLQVVLVKPERFDDARPVADHLNSKHTVVLNLEETNKETVRRILDFFARKNNATPADHKEMMPIVMACMNMSKRKEGALIVIEQGDKLGEIIKTGESIDAAINQLLIENIFF